MFETFFFFILVLTSQQQCYLIIERNTQLKMTIWYMGAYMHVPGYAFNNR